MNKYKLLFCFFVLVGGVIAQTGEKPMATVFGNITDLDSREPVDLVNVFIQGTNQVVESNENGYYQIQVPANEKLILVFSRVGFSEVRANIDPVPVANSRRINVELAPIQSGVEVIVNASRIDDRGMIGQDVSQLRLLPTVSGNLESVLPSIALGTSSGSGGELTSQYNVRGGNYDENLVYVNDFEIYRPQLIRAGQQEGLSFPNIDLISSLSFSSGGFEAKYGHKLSSVLDIKYKRPEKFAASATGSLLGASAHFEGAYTVGGDKYRKFRYLVGARYKTTKYLLGSLDVTGEYAPNFFDLQTYLTYDISRSWQVGFLTNLNRSEYNFIPETRSTAFGLIDFALELFSVFDGQEVSDFTTNMNGLSFTYLPDRDKNPFFWKFLISSQSSDENEQIDIISDYSLRQIDSNLGSDNFGEVLQELGTGTQHQYVRNYLDSRVSNIEVKGGIELQQEPNEKGTIKSNFIQWSGKFQYEDIKDRIHEWERLDSAGYSLPFDEDIVQVFGYLDTDNTLRSSRLTASLQNTFSWQNDSIAEIKWSYGVNGQYWTLNDEFLVNPRTQILFKPLNVQKDISYKLAAGLYYQPPFYRELRGFDGRVNQGLLAQKSAHIVGGLTYDFYWGKLSPKKFRLIVEAYYKRLWDLVSYEIDNVRIRYSAMNDSQGYVTGVDLRLNGEFVPGAESWLNLSLLSAKEALNGVQHLERELGDTTSNSVKYVSRPTDQLLQMSLFFQDYLPKNENFTMHLNLTVGSGLPYGLLDNNRVYRNTYKFSPYHRVDIGFSALLWSDEWRDKKPKSFLNFTKKTWLSLEIYNLLKVQNAASNTWIKTIFEQRYAVRNYLTSRRINLKLRMEF